MKTSVAYDLAQFAPEQERQPKVKVVNTAKKRANEKRASRVKVMACFMVLAVLMAATVYSKMQLTETAASISQCNAQLTALESENTYLSFELESMVSLKYAEEYAVSELGLVKLGSSQIEYVTLNTENAIVSAAEAPSFVDSLEGFFKLVIDFIAG